MTNREKLLESLAQKKFELADARRAADVATDQYVAHKRRLKAEIANLTEALAECSRRTARVGVDPHPCEVKDDALADEQKFSKAPQMAPVDPLERT